MIYFATSYIQVINHSDYSFHCCCLLDIVIFSCFRFVVDTIMLSSFLRQSHSLHSSFSRHFAKSLPYIKNHCSHSLQNRRELNYRSLLLGIRFHSTSSRGKSNNYQVQRIKGRDITSEESLGLTKKPDFSPLSVLTQNQLAKVTTTEVGMENLNISEGDLVEIDNVAKQLADMLNTPFSEETYLELKDINVDKTFNKIKDTLHIDNLPKAIKAIRVLSAQDRTDDALFIWDIIKQDPSQCTLFAWTAYLNTLCSHGQTHKSC